MKSDYSFTKGSACYHSQKGSAAYHLDLRFLFTRLGFVLDFLVVLVAPVVFPAVFLFLTAATFLLSAAFPALDAVVGATGRATGWFSPIKTESGSGPCCMSEGPLEAYMIVIYCEHTSWSICDSMVSLGYKVRRRW